MHKRDATWTEAAKMAAALAIGWFYTLRQDSKAWVYWTAFLTVACVVVFIYQWRHEAPLRIKYPYFEGEPVAVRAYSWQDYHRLAWYVGPSWTPGMVRIRLPGRTFDSYVGIEDVHHCYVAR